MPNDKNLELAIKYYNEDKYNECLPLIEGILSQGGLSDEQTALWMFRKGVCQSRVGDNKAAITAYETLIARFKDSDDLQINLILAKGAVNLINVFGNDKQLNKAEDIFLKLKAIATTFPKNKEINLTLAQGAFNLINVLKNDKQLVKAEDVFHELKAIATRFPKNQKINLILAQGTVNLIAMLGDDMQLVKAEDVFHELKAIATKFQENQEINLMLALSAFNLVEAFRYDKQLSNVENIFYELQEIAKKFPNDQEINLTLAECSVNVINELGNNKQFNKAEDVFDQLKAVTAKFEDNQEINLELAKGAFNLINFWKNADNPQEAKKIFAELKTLANRFSENADINLQLARAEFNLIDDWKNTEQSHEAYKKLLTLAKKFTDNTKINTIFAESALSLIINLKRENKPGDAQTVLNELKTVAQQFPNNPEINLFLAKGAYNLTGIVKNNIPIKSIIDKFEKYIDHKRFPQNWKLERDEQIIVWKSKHKKDTAKWFYALISIYEKCHDEIKKACARNLSPKEKISHFTSTQALFSILGYDRAKEISEKTDNKTNNKELKNILRGYNAIYMNDPSEGRSLVEYSHRHTNDQIPDLRKFFKDGENKWVEHDAGKSVFSISFTAANDSLPLWRAYGRDGRGVCIVIPTNKLKQHDDDDENYITGKYLFRKSNSNEKNDTMATTPKRVQKSQTDPNLMPEDLYKIRYISHDKNDSVNDSVNDFLEKLKEYIDLIIEIKDKLEKGKNRNKATISIGQIDQIIEQINQAVREALAGALYLFKDAQYATEQEYRMITMRNIQENGIFFDEADIPHLYLKTRPFVFEAPETEIILGPGVKDPEVLRLSIERILALNCPPLSDKIKIKYSTVQYRPSQETDKIWCPAKK